MNKKFKLYTVNIKYIRDLHKVDSLVPSVSPQLGKHTRPFLGIIVLVNGFHYCIPLSSNSFEKNKNFEKMKENITLRKIRDNKNNILAVLNLNNMIPIREEYIFEIDLKIHPSDPPELAHRKILCNKELKWCQSHQNEIERLANELYRKYCSEESFGKRKICLNFPALEKTMSQGEKLFAETIKRGCYKTLNCPLPFVQ